MGQDFAELLGVIGILPIHPSTHLRLRKVHETRANTVIRETPGMLGEVTVLDAAKKRLQLEDEFEYSRRDGVNALVDGECKFYCRQRFVSELTEKFRFTRMIENFL